MNNCLVPTDKVRVRQLWGFGPLQGLAAHGRAHGSRGWRTQVAAVTHCGASHQKSTVLLAAEFLRPIDRELCLRSTTRRYCLQQPATSSEFDSKSQDLGMSSASEWLEAEARWPHRWHLRCRAVPANSANLGQTHTAL